jgi:hypothetical protein
MNTIQLAADVVDYGGNPEFFVTGIASITRVSAGVIRESFYSEHQSADGSRSERRLVLSVLWDAEAWFAARRVVAAVDPAHVPALSPKGQEPYGLKSTH